jgi:hypothetical protein
MCTAGGPTVCKGCASACLEAVANASSHRARSLYKRSGRPRRCICRRLSRRPLAATRAAFADLSEPSFEQRDLRRHRGDRFEPSDRSAKFVGEPEPHSLRSPAGAPCAAGSKQRGCGAGSGGHGAGCALSRRSGHAAGRGPCADAVLRALPQLFASAAHAPLLPHAREPLEQPGLVPPMLASAASCECCEAAGRGPAARGDAERPVRPDARAPSRGCTPSAALAWRKFSGASAAEGSARSSREARPSLHRTAPAPLTRAALRSRASSLPRRRASQTSIRWRRRS